MKSMLKHTIGIRVTSFILVLMFIFSPVAPALTPREAHAAGAAVTCAAPSPGALLVVPVAEGAEYWECVKDTPFGLDTLMQAILKGFVKTLFASLITWVNSGFEGKPVFVDDLKLYFEDMKNAVATEFLSELLGADACDFFGDLDVLFQTRPGVVQEFKAQARCTLDDIGIDAERFFDNFSEGGWYAYEQSISGSNNPFAIYINGQDALHEAEREALDQEEQRLSLSSGFKSFVDDFKKVTTPGKMIEARLGTAVGSDLRQLELADEFDELFSALVNQLVSGVFKALK